MANNKVARIHNGKIVSDSAEVIKPTETAARSRREADRNNHRAEILQPNQVDFYKVNPEKAENLSPELRRLLS